MVLPWHTRSDTLEVIAHQTYGSNFSDAYSMIYYEDNDIVGILDFAEYCCSMPMHIACMRSEN